MPEYIHLLTTALRYMAIWHVEMSGRRIRRHHCPELVEFYNPGILFVAGHYAVDQMLNHTELDGTKDIRYHNSHHGDAFDIPEDAF